MALATKLACLGGQHRALVSNGNNDNEHGKAPQHTLWHFTFSARAQAT
jgi:hypothetical protein